MTIRRSSQKDWTASLVSVALMGGQALSKSARLAGQAAGDQQIKDPLLLAALFSARSPRRLEIDRLDRRSTKADAVEQLYVRPMQSASGLGQHQVRFVG
ncbi:hypothetical protein AB0L65_37290 [Nonomuraea sp. NPDC052116]|uniref:hypothetical protein n=1 Tax=Nonomuraea sp. NPDC052116 TaxID=3155665 RepID=UPI0034181309